mmetsp:Transcript_14111/g.36215  ORF Transcript_14111/g.36215 Transcript_14111/m.36215 type:complete len:398 (+) Transcript_14111:255-1448(+)
MATSAGRTAGLSTLRVGLPLRLRLAAPPAAGFRTYGAVPISRTTRLGPIAGAGENGAPLQRPAAKADTGRTRRPEVAASPPPPADATARSEEPASKLPPPIAPAVLPSLAFQGKHSLKTGVLTVICEDSAGIIGTVTSFLHMHGANIEDCRTHSTPGNVFTMRVQFSLPEHWLGVVREAFEVMIAAPYHMKWALKWEDEPKRIAVLCTKEDHALMEILWGVVRNDLRCEVAAVISNHTDLRGTTEGLGFAFHHVPVDKERKAEAEAAIKGAVGEGVDLVVLARYMQVLSPEFIDSIGAPIINIHHSFLPAFKGANPYRQAHEKGVRLIGATAHYVTAELDQGPIIEQDVARVNHRMSVPDFRAMGRSVECKVLHRAVKWHLEDRVFMVEGNKTVVFS